MQVWWVLVLLSASIAEATFSDFLRSKHERIFGKSILNFYQFGKPCLNPSECIFTFSSLLEATENFLSSSEGSFFTASHCVALNLSKFLTVGVRESLYSLGDEKISIDRDVLAVIDGFLSFDCVIEDEGAVRFYWNEREIQFADKYELLQFLSDFSVASADFITPVYFGKESIFQYGNGHLLSILPSEPEKDVLPTFYMNLLLIDIIPCAPNWFLQVKSLLASEMSDSIFQEFKRDLVLAFNGCPIELFQCETPPNIIADSLDFYKTKNVCDLLFLMYSAYKNGSQNGSFENFDALNHLALQTFDLNLSFGIYGDNEKSFLANLWHLLTVRDNHLKIVKLCRKHLSLQSPHYDICYNSQTETVISEQDEVIPKKPLNLARNLWEDIEKANFDRKVETSENVSRTRWAKKSDKKDPVQEASLTSQRNATWRKVIDQPTVPKWGRREINSIDDSSGTRKIRDEDERKGTSNWPKPSDQHSPATWGSKKSSASFPSSSRGEQNNEETEKDVSRWPKSIDQGPAKIWGNVKKSSSNESGRILENEEKALNSPKSIDETSATKWGVKKNTVSHPSSRRSEQTETEAEKISKWSKPNDQPSSRTWRIQESSLNDDSSKVVEAKNRKEKKTGSNWRKPADQVLVGRWGVQKDSMNDNSSNLSEQKEDNVEKTLSKWGNSSGLKSIDKNSDKQNNTRMPGWRVSKIVQDLVEKENSRPVLEVEDLNSYASLAREQPSRPKSEETKQNEAQTKVEEVKEIKKTESLRLKPEPLKKSPQKQSSKTKKKESPKKVVEKQRNTSPVTNVIKEYVVESKPKEVPEKKTKIAKKASSPKKKSSSVKKIEEKAVFFFEAPFELHESLNTRSVCLVGGNTSEKPKFINSLMPLEAIGQKMQSLEMGTVPSWSMFNFVFKEARMHDDLYLLSSSISSVRDENGNLKLHQLISMCHEMESKWIRGKPLLIEDDEVERILLIDEIRKILDFLYYSMYNDSESFSHEFFGDCLISMYFTYQRLEWNINVCNRKLLKNEFCLMLKLFMDDYSLIFKEVESLIGSPGSKVLCRKDSLQAAAKLRLESRSKAAKIYSSDFFTFVKFFQRARNVAAGRKNGMKVEGLNYSVDFKEPKLNFDITSPLMASKALNPKISSQQAKDKGIFLVFLQTLSQVYSNVTLSKNKELNQAVKFFSLLSHEFVFDESFDIQITAKIAKKLFSSLFLKFINQSNVISAANYEVFERAMKNNCKLDLNYTYAIIYYVGFSLWSNSHSIERSKLFESSTLIILQTFRVLCNLLSIEFLAAPWVEEESEHSNDKKLNDFWALISSNKSMDTLIKESRKIMDCGNLKEISMAKYTSEVSLKNFRSEKIASTAKIIAVRDYCSKITETGSLYIEISGGKYKKINDNGLGSLCRFLDGKMTNFLESDLKNILASLPGYKVIDLPGTPFELVSFRFSKVVAGKRESLAADFLIDKGFTCYSHPLLFNSVLNQVLDFFGISLNTKVALEPSNTIIPLNETGAFLSEIVTAEQVDLFSQKFESILESQKAPIYEASRLLWLHKNCTPLFETFLTSQSIEHLSEHFIKVSLNELLKYHRPIVTGIMEYGKDPEKDEKFVELVLNLAELMKVSQEFNLAVNSVKEVAMDQIINALYVLEVAGERISRLRSKKNETSPLISDMVERMKNFIIGNNLVSYAPLFNSIKSAAKRLVAFMFSNGSLIEFPFLRERCAAWICKLKGDSKISFLVAMEEELLPLFPGVQNFIVPPSFIRSMHFVEKTVTLSVAEKQLLMSALMEEKFDVDVLEETGDIQSDPKKILKSINDVISRLKSSPGVYDDDLLIQAISNSLFNALPKFESLLDAEVYLSWNSLALNPYDIKDPTQNYALERYNAYFLDHLLSKNIISAPQFKQYHLIARAFSNLSMIRILLSDLSKMKMQDYPPIDQVRLACEREHIKWSHGTISICKSFEIALKDLKDSNGILRKRDFVMIMDHLAEAEVFSKVKFQNAPISIYRLCENFEPFSATKTFSVRPNEHLMLLEDPANVMTLLAVLEALGIH